MPGKMMTNYMGNAIYAMGRASHSAYFAARKGADTALSHSIAKYAVPAGLGILGASAMSNDHPLIGMGLMGAGGFVAGRGAISGAYGSMGGFGGPTGKIAGYANRMMGSRMMQKAMGPGYYTPTTAGRFRAGFY